MHTQAYLYLCALASACMPTHMPTCLHTLIYIKCKYGRLNMHTKEIYQVRKFWFVHDPVERPVFHWLSIIIRLTMGLIIPFVHSMINEFCCPCNNLGVFILHQIYECLHAVKGSKIRIFILNSTKEVVALVCENVATWQEISLHSSSKPWHTLQFRCPTEVVGLVCRPLSTSKVWNWFLISSKPFGI